MPVRRVLELEKGHLLSKVTLNRSEKGCAHLVQLLFSLLNRYLDSGVFQPSLSHNRGD